MASQRKEYFFEALNKLDSSSGDEDHQEMPTDPRVLKQSKTFPAPRPSKKRKISNNDRPSAITPSSSDPIRAVAAPASRPRNPEPPSTLRRTQSDNSSTTKKKTKKAPKSKLPAVPQIFAAHRFFFVPNHNDNSARRSRVGKAIARGAEWARDCTDEVTHIIIDNDIDIKKEASKAFPGGLIPPRVPLVKEEWLVDCLNRTTVRDVYHPAYRVIGMKTPFDLLDTEEADPSVAESEALMPVDHAEASAGETDISTAIGDDLDQAVHLVQKLGLMDFKHFIDDEPSASSVDGQDVEEASDLSEPSDSILTKEFSCMKKHDGSTVSPNIRCMILLQELADFYQRTGRREDEYRALSYRRAVGALRREPELVRTKEQAKDIKYIGESIGAKIEEIETTGQLRKLNILKADPDEKVLMLFMGIYGAGPGQAQRWKSQNFRSLEDLLEKADLTPNQRIGIDHYDDFQQRIPREEVEKHAEVIEKVLKSADSGLLMTIGGSYRRGNIDSGDIDILITKEGADLQHIRTLMEGTVIPELRQNGFLKAELATGRSRDDGSKWHGASALPNSSTWRRLDLLYVPSYEMGAALIYFTGNDIFNRSVRLLASWKGMRLNQHGLYKDVMRGRRRIKITEGSLLEGKDEKRIFEILGVPYRPPEHRKC